jgi:hypothetical protein
MRNDIAVTAGAVTTLRGSRPMPEYGWGYPVVLLEYGCVRCQLDYDLWLRYRLGEF